jgi:hypothetical protein
MNNSTCEIRLAESFGTMQDARYLGNHLGIRVSRTHLLGRGIHVDMSTLAQQAGFQIHVFFRREAFAHLTEHQSQFRDIKHDLYDAILAMRDAMMKAPLRDCPVPFQVGDATLIAFFGPVDHDDPRRAVTVVLADKD